MGQPTLQLSVPAGLPVDGMPFLLIDNDGADPVVGTFAGMPEGATLTIAGVPFQISYIAGTGNDVVVTTLAGGPKAWNGGASDLWSAAGNWYGWAPPVSGDTLYFPYYGAVHHAMTNDLVGLTLASANAPLGDFSVGGNAVVVNGGVTGFAGWNVPTTLGASQTFRVTSIGNTLDLNGHTLSLEGGTYVAGSFVGSGSVVLKTDQSLSVAGASTFTGPFVVSPGASLAVSGSITNSTLTVGAGGALTGGGTVPATSLTGATLQSSDVLSTGNLSVQGGTSIFQIRIDFTGTHNDKIRTTGRVTLGHPTLQLNIPASLPVAGQTFLLIDNDGADPVVGTFQGLPEGATFEASGADFQISYVAGTGNDVVVTALSMPSCTISSSANPAPAGASIVLTAHVALVPRSADGPGFLHRRDDGPRYDVARFQRQCGDHRRPRAGLAHDRREVRRRRTLRAQRLEPPDPDGSGWNQSPRRDSDTGHTRPDPPGRGPRGRGHPAGVQVTNPKKEPTMKRCPCLDPRRVGDLHFCSRAPLRSSARSRAPG